MGLHRGPARQAWRRVGGGDGREWQRGVDVAAQAWGVGGRGGALGALLQGQLSVRQVEASPLSVSVRKQRDWLGQRVGEQVT